MGFYIVRFSEGDSSEPLWGVERDERVLPLEVRSTTLRELIERGGIEAARARLDDPRDDGARSPEELTFWSPVTHPCQIVCQGKNYLEHLKETGTRPQDKTFNLLFSKASSTLNRPDGPVVRPAGVKLMDYECELGLVIGRRLGAPRRFTPETITEVVGGIVLANDVSARDVQVPQGQWYRGKSYRGFCPVGPRLYWLDPGDGPRIYQLALSLWVNDGLRQQALQFGFPPAESFTPTRWLHDGDTVELGGTVLTATLAAGHTQGCTSWSLRTIDGGKFFNVTIFGCNGPNDGVQLVNNPRFPTLIEDTMQGFDNLAKLQPDIYLTGHPEQPFDGIIDMMRTQTRPHPLLQQQPWQEMIADRRAAIETRVAQERAAQTER